MKFLHENVLMEREREKGAALIQIIMQPIT
jgi:hypothetical protein